MKNILDSLKTTGTYTTLDMTEEELQNIANTLELPPEQTLQYTYATGELKIVDIPDEIREALERARTSPTIQRPRRPRPPPQ